MRGALAVRHAARMRRRSLLAAAVAVALCPLVALAPAAAAGEVGTTFPDGFRVPVDASLGQPVLGFGSAEGPVRRPPVIFLHGNNDTPYPTSCNGSYGAMRDFAQAFADAGWALGELWALGYQGDQCDLLTDQTRRAGVAHTTVANVPDLRAFVREVLAFTGATQVDVIGHSLGASLAREWMRQDDAYGVVRRLVSVDGPHHGILNCSPSPQNYYVTIGFTPDSPVCLEYGAADTPLLTALNAGDETPGPTEYLAIVNADTSFVYIPEQDGVLPAVPAQDRHGRPHDFSRSAVLDGATVLDVRGQGAHDRALQAAHTGVAASPEVWQAAIAFLAPPPKPDDAATPVPTTAPTSTGAAPAADVARAPVTSTRALPATGGSAPGWLAAVVVAVLVCVVTVRGTRRRG
jgi:pimeloyl-ACP methyl ester carboxylesterase